MTADPWGPLDWLLRRDPTLTANARCLGVLSSEARSVRVPILASRWAGSAIKLVRIDDPPSRYSIGIASAIEARRAQLRTEHVEYTEHGQALLADDQQIADILSELVDGWDGESRTIWLDISSMPKRYFFLLVKLALSSSLVDNFVVTYTQPSPGGYVDAHLAEDPDDLRPLPGYTPFGAPSTLVVAVGFESLGLPQFLDEYRDKKRRIVLLIPFPPGQPYAQRIWQTVQRFGLRTLGEDSRRVAALDAFATVRQLRALCEAERAEAADATSVSFALAPYGPKPVSLGMCLFAISETSAVFYTQPRCYHPDYSTGVGQSWAYLLKAGGVPINCHQA